MADVRHIGATPTAEAPVLLGERRTQVEGRWRVRPLRHVQEAWDMERLARIVSGRPDQLDQQVAMAINEIRRQANQSRINVLFVPPKKYKTITADMVVRLEP